MPHISLTAACIAAASIAAASTAAAIFGAQDKVIEYNSTAHCERNNVSAGTEPGHGNGNAGGVKIRCEISINNFTRSGHPR